MPTRPGNEGSSPLARGGLPHRRRAVPDRRLIPAGAGRTPPSKAAYDGDTAHPRWRGEDLVPVAGENPSPGSSPLARGGRVPAPRGPLLCGLIPAGAGRTRCHSCRPCRRWAHPRWRGEDPVGAHQPRLPGGSSPLARGGLGRAVDELDQLRLIPAGAGRTLGPPTVGRNVRAHPRWRGEDPPPDSTLTAEKGSSPLARGGREFREDQGLGVRLIPAGAGRTLHYAASALSPWAHPRWRGEDLTIHFHATSCPGSSPLARGGPSATIRTLRIAGLIPAGAGRTHARGENSCAPTAHPRWRGEDHSTLRVRVPMFGSSPLARGGHHHPHGGHCRVRLIPAGAGRTPPAA